MPPDDFSIQHLMDNGIERIVYLPRQRRFETPILMQHGMWHGAWCWQHWQALFAGWGWESHAISLPGHAGSPTQRPIYFCTLDYYLKFLKAEIERLLPRKPILMGHSMGGALTQWYLRYVADDLPAAVLVAPWDLRGTFADGAIPRWLQLDLVGVVLAPFFGARVFIRTPQHAARKLISAQAIYTPEELHARLGPESFWVMLQHNPPWWRPPKRFNTPILWIAGEQDTVIGLEAERRSAERCQADWVVVPQAAHNLMMEHNYRETAETIHAWFVRHTIP